MSTHGGNGPRCRGCDASEARCAFLNGCCEEGCTHFTHLDTDGNDVHGNHDTCSTEQGYQRHRYRREAACEACKFAHARHNERRQAS